MFRLGCCWFVKRDRTFVRWEGGGAGRGGGWGGGGGAGGGERGVAAKNFGSIRGQLAKATSFPFFREANNMSLCFRGNMSKVELYGKKEPYWLILLTATAESLIS